MGVVGGESEEYSELSSSSWNVSGEFANLRVRMAG